MKATLEPSGENVANWSADEVSVSRRWSEPSAFITYSSRLPSRVDSKTILDPSGDHDGYESSVGLVVRRTWSRPFASMV